MTTGLLLTILRELLVAGNETTAKTIAQLVLMLDGRSDEWARVRADPSHADAIAEEALRITSASLSAHRRVTRPSSAGSGCRRGDRVCSRSPRPTTTVGLRRPRRVRSGSRPATAAASGFRAGRPHVRRGWPGWNCGSPYGPWPTTWSGSPW